MKTRMCEVDVWEWKTPNPGVYVIHLILTEGASGVRGAKVYENTVRHVTR